MTDATTQVREIVESTYRSDSRRVLATLVRLLHDFDLAEEAIAAYTAARDLTDGPQRHFLDRSIADLSEGAILRKMSASRQLRDRIF